MAPISTDEIEIAPEMIDAGEDAIWSGFSGGEIPADFSPRGMAVAVFRAMATLSPRMISCAPSEDNNTSEQ
jgi:hypothetical protein